MSANSPCQPPEWNIHFRPIPAKTLGVPRCCGIVRYALIASVSAVSSGLDPPDYPFVPPGCGAPAVGADRENAEHGARLTRRTASDWLRRKPCSRSQTHGDRD